MSYASTRDPAGTWSKDHSNVMASPFGSLEPDAWSSTGSPAFAFRDTSNDGMGGPFCSTAGPWSGSPEPQAEITTIDHDQGTIGPPLSTRPLSSAKRPRAT